MNTKKTLTKYINKVKIENIIIFLILLASFSIRFLFINKNALWLDEKYSIYFANSFSFKNLLFGFQADIHPGLSYSIIKFILIFFKNNIILRSIIGLLPQLVGILIIFIYRKKFLIDKKSALLIALFFGLNPFFVHLSWQIRMYSLVFLQMILIHLEYQKNKTSANFKSSLLFWFYIFLTNMTQYSTMFFTLPIALLSALRFAKTKKRQVVVAGLVTTAYLTQFIISNGTIFKAKFNHFNWVSIPTIKNIPHLSLTILGFNKDTHSQGSTNFFEIIIFMLLTYGLFMFFKKNKNLVKSNIKNTKKELYFFVLLPIATIITISLLLPFLSQRAFFHSFIPRVSMFLPRVFLPGIITLLIYLPRIFKKNIFSKLFLVFITICVPFWIKMNFSNNTNSISPKTNDFLEKKSDFIFPSWFALEKIKKENLTLAKMENAKTIFEKSAKKEEAIIPIKYLKTSNHCEEFKNKKVLILRKRFNEYQQPNNNLTKIINSCCKQQNTDQENEIWTCS